MKLTKGGNKATTCSAIALAVTVLAVTVLSGCQFTGGGLVPPSSDPVRQQVEACGAGFDSSVSAELVANYDIKKEELSGTANAGVKASAATSTLYLSLLPENNRLAAYELYTKCLKAEINYPKGTEPPSITSAQTAVETCSGKSISVPESQVQFYGLDDLNNSVIKGDESDFIRLEIAKLYFSCLDNFLASK